MSGVRRKAGKSEPKFIEQIRPAERAFQVVLVLKNLPANTQDESWVPSLEEGMATHSSILAWRTPWTEQPGGLLPIGYQELDMTEAT